MPVRTMNGRSFLPWLVPALLVVSAPAAASSNSVCTIEAAFVRHVPVKRGQPMTFVVDVTSKKFSGYGRNHCKRMKNKGLVIQVKAGNDSFKNVSLAKGDQLVLHHIELIDMMGHKMTFWRLASYKKADKKKPDKKKPRR